MFVHKAEPFLRSGRRRRLKVRRMGGERTINGVMKEGLRHMEARRRACLSQIIVTTFHG